MNFKNEPEIFVEEGIVSYNVCDSSSKQIREIPAKLQNVSFGAPPLKVIKRTTDGIYQCSDCSFIAKSQDTLRGHIRRFHETMRYTCDLCGFQHYSKYTLATHVSLYLQRFERNLTCNN